MVLRKYLTCTRKGYSMTESCRLVTTEQYKEYQLLKKKLDIAVNALKDYADELNWDLNMDDMYQNESGSRPKDIFDGCNWNGFEKAQQALKEIRR